MCIYNYIKVISLIILWLLAVLTNEVSPLSSIQGPRRHSLTGRINFFGHPKNQSSVKESTEKPLPEVKHFGIWPPLSGASEESPVLRVANGEKAKLGEFPYQIALKKPISTFSTYYSTYCGGGLIAANKVLTAAHCLFEEAGFCERMFSGKEKKLVSIMFAVAASLKSEGRKGVTSNEQWQRIRSMSIPSGYKFPDQDIAVSFTREPFVLNMFVQPIPFATKHIDYGKLHCELSGYGELAPAVKSETLMWAFVILVKNDVCSHTMGKNMTNFICSSSDIATILYGDSGGPLVCFNTTDPAEKKKGVIVGIACAGAEGPGAVYTRVSSFKTFIEQSNLSTSLTIGITFYCIVMSNFIRIIV